MTPTFWNIIKPQLDELASVWIDKYGFVHLMKVMSGQLYWWEQEPFASTKLEFENCNLSLVQWMNAVEAIMGRPLDDVFEETLKLRIKDTIEYQFELKVRGVA